MTTLAAPDDPTWSAAAGSAPANVGVHPDLAPAHLLEEPSVGVLSVVAAAWLLAASPAAHLPAYLAARATSSP